MLHFDAEAHAYFVDGVRLPHVTQVTGMLGDYYGVPAAVLEAKAKLGTAVHTATEYYDQDDLGFVSEAVQPYLEAWIKFRVETGFVPEQIERRVYSATYRYAGTLDRIGRFTKLKLVKPAEGCLIDLKCTWSVLPAVGPQTAAYLQAVNEIDPGARIRKRFAVQLKPDGTYNLVPCTDPTDWSVFLSGLSILAWKARHAAQESP